MLLIRIEIELQY